MRSANGYRIKPRDEIISSADKSTHVLNPDESIASCRCDSSGKRFSARVAQHSMGPNLDGGRLRGQFIGPVASHPS
jgi:hypothetical protein